LRVIFGEILLENLLKIVILALDFWVGGRYNTYMTNANNKGEKMSNFERAINNVNTLIANGWSMKEAIIETAWEFGVAESELWCEFPEN
jgi:hypothetical protein